MTVEPRTAAAALRDEYPGIWYWEDPRWGDRPLGEVIESEARAAALREVAEAVKGLRNPYTTESLAYLGFYDACRTILTRLDTAILTEATGASE